MMLTGTVLTAYMVSQLSVFLSQINASQREYRHKMDAVQVLCSTGRRCSREVQWEEVEWEEEQHAGSLTTPLPSLSRRATCATWRCLVIAM